VVIILAKATAEQLKLINKFAKEPLTEENALVHGFRLIGTRLITDRYLKIDKSLLDIYLQDIKNGDVVQIADHSMGRFFSGAITLPFGRFFDGKLAEEGGETHLDAWMYMKAGQKTYIEPFTTDDISEQLNAGTLHDNSVGISWDRSECSICGNDIRDYENCQHWPGRTYKVNGKDLLCYVIAKPIEGDTSHAYMAENSLVGVGAYPDAGHLAKEGQSDKPKYRKVNDMLELKLIPKEEPVFCLFSANNTEILTKSEVERDANKLHQLYHKMQETKDLPLGWTFGTLNAKHKEVVKELLEAGYDHYLDDVLDGTLPSEMKSKSLRREETTLDALIAEIFNKAGIDPAQIEKATEQGFVMKDGKQFSVVDVQAAQAAAAPITHYMTQEQVKEKFSKELSADEVLALAKDGEMLRKEVIEAAIAAGVRAQGNDFPADTWRNTFATMSIQAIRDIEKTFQKQAEAEIPVGRQTVPGSLGKEHRPEIPNEAYKA
jgi:hypothetical protein